ncbi:MAG: hypothetical protein WC538_24215 [Thermoanaerobaculia bacterium]
MHEPAVTLTDYGLTIECWTLAWLVMRSNRTALRPWWIAFFGFIGLASLIGGTVHGFFPDESTTLYTILWDANLIAIGCTAVAIWSLGALLTGSAPLARWVTRIAFALLALYAGIVVFVSNRFLVAIGMYLPAVIFLTVTMSMTHARAPRQGWGVGIVGLALTYLAAAAQQLKVALHPVYFDHNALYHVIQGLALFLVFLAQSRASRAPAA